jgi:hypothetical protein
MNTPTKKFQPRQHQWIPSPLGHGEFICLNCRITNREAAILLRNDVCDKEWVDKELNQ